MINDTYHSPSFFAGITKFFNEVCSALFVSTDKKEFQRLKDFITS